MSLVVVITGANNGIGFHMAQALLEKGHRVAAIEANASHPYAPLQGSI